MLSVAFSVVCRMAPSWVEASENISSATGAAVGAGEPLTAAALISL